MKDRAKREAFQVSDQESLNVKDVIDVICLGGDIDDFASTLSAIMASTKSMMSLMSFALGVILMSLHEHH